MKYSQQGNLKHSTTSVHNYIQDLHRNGGQFFLILLGSDVVGTLTIREFKNRIFNLGIMVYESNNNSQVATEAIRVAINRLRSNNASEVHMGTHVANMAMRRVIEKLGFQLFEEAPAVLDKDKIFFVKSLLDE